MDNWGLLGPPHIALTPLPCAPPRITPKIVTPAGAGARWPITRVSPPKVGGDTPKMGGTPPQRQDPNRGTPSYSFSP